MYSQSAGIAFETPFCRLELVCEWMALRPLAPRCLPALRHEKLLFVTIIITKQETHDTS